MERDDIRVEVFGKTIDEVVIKQLISDIKQKKELRSFCDNTILKYMKYFLNRQRAVRELLLEDIDISEMRKKRLYQSLLKQVRDVARRTYGMYITKEYDKRFDYLKKNDWKGLLDLHLSTKERKIYYQDICKGLVSKTVYPKTILDLACGFNPIGILEVFSKKITYVASDISNEDCLFLDEALKKHPIAKKGSYAKACDLTNPQKEKDLLSIKADWCLLFKALDPLEEIHEGITLELLPFIRSKIIIASFPTITISRKPMRNPRRSWFEKVLVRLNLPFEIFETQEELFYIITNKES